MGEGARRLSDLAVGEIGVVAGMEGEGPGRRRMLDMGLVPGAEVKVIRLAPLGDPIEFRVRGYRLSLRKREAERVGVAPV